MEAYNLKQGKEFSEPRFTDYEGVSHLNVMDELQAEGTTNPKTLVGEDPRVLTERQGAKVAGELEQEYGRSHMLRAWGELGRQIPSGFVAP